MGCLMPKQQKGRETGVPRFGSRPSEKTRVKKAAEPRPIAAVTVDGVIVPPVAYNARAGDVLLEVEG